MSEPTPSTSTESATTTTSSTNLSITVKGPDTKLTISLPTTSTVLELKSLIHDQANNFPIEQQRLIYSGRVLKDEDNVSKYNLKDGHTIHLVKGAAPASSASTGQVVPNNFAAGQQVAGNPLAPLMNAQNAGAVGSFNPFAQMGINTNDPNYMQNMMNDPSVQSNMANMLSDPAIIDQVIASNPELRAMGPQVRQLMQSEHFRSFLSNPEAMRNMMQMAGNNPGAGMGGMGGMAGMFGGGAAGATPPSTGAAPAGGAPTNLFNPWGNTPAAATNPAGGAGAAPFNPFAGGAPGGGGGTPDFAQLMNQMQQLQAMGFGPGATPGGTPGALGGFGGAAPPAVPTGPVVPPEERYQNQLEQLAGMGFVDARRNIQALQASGGNVEMAIEFLFSN